LLASKDFFDVGSWNIRTAYVIGKTATLMKEARRYKLSIPDLNKITGRQVLGKPGQ